MNSENTEHTVSMDSDVYERECMICFNEPYFFKILACTHRVCDTCMKTIKDCPLCRRRIDMEKIQHVCNVDNVCKDIFTMGGPRQTQLCTQINKFN